MQVHLSLPFNLSWLTAGGLQTLLPCLSSFIASLCSAYTHASTHAHTLKCNRHTWKTDYSYSMLVTTMAVMNPVWNNLLIYVLMSNYQITVTKRTEEIFSIHTCDTHGVCVQLTAYDSFSVKEKGGESSASWLCDAVSHTHTSTHTCIFFSESLI